MNISIPDRDVFKTVQVNELPLNVLTQISVFHQTFIDVIGISDITTTLRFHENDNYIGLWYDHVFDNNQLNELKNKTTNNVSLNTTAQLYVEFKIND